MPKDVNFKMYYELVNLRPIFCLWNTSLNCSFSKLLWRMSLLRNYWQYSVLPAIFHRLVLLESFLLV